jgi:hypothetical protein
LLASSPSAATYALLGAAIGGVGSTPVTMAPLAIGLVIVTVVAYRIRRRSRLTIAVDGPSGNR